MPPDPSLTTAADFLRMVNGAAVEERFATALDTYITTVIDNGLSASTFAARVIISTRASLASAVVGAYGAFTGALHGGAPGLALDMLDEIADERRRSTSGSTASSRAGERLMGFGHRVFRAARSARRHAARRLAAARSRQQAPRLRPARSSARAVAALQRRKPGRRLEANIEMDAALLLDAIGLPREAFTPVFAMARSPAWIAHALEQQSFRPHDSPGLDLCGANANRPEWPTASPLSRPRGGSLKAGRLSKRGPSGPQGTT